MSFSRSNFHSANNYGVTFLGGGSKDSEGAVFGDHHKGIRCNKLLPTIKEAIIKGDHIRNITAVSGTVGLDQLIVLKDKGTVFAAHAVENQTVIALGHIFKGVINDQNIGHLQCCRGCPGNVGD